ncbi:hypothetical protein EYC80_007694 [Monilinia laxa]|uniref:Uncharacterized protein n=1 Tax=Monilinia laxa TaxID=61186 RepID=A0A5N6JWQ2_MONLA|nr:hypothetical protein EYC80_007694 [Monilinia laxa]
MYVSCTWLENSENLNTRGDGMNLSFRIQSHSRLIGLDSVYLVSVSRAAIRIMNTKEMRGRRVMKCWYCLLSLTRAKKHQERDIHPSSIII